MGCGLVRGVEMTTHAELLEKMRQPKGSAKYKLWAVLLLHNPEVEKGQDNVNRTYCAEDGFSWPCNTARACGVTE